MSERSLRQYFGPSARHDRACVELRFAQSAATYRLAPLEQALAHHGFRLSEALPDDPMPLAQAVSHLAHALLAGHSCRWSSHGSDGEGRGWAVLAYPLPEIAALALDVAFGVIVSAGQVPSKSAYPRRLSGWLSTVMKTRLRMLAAADLHGLDALRLVPTSELYQLGQGAKGLHFDQASNELDAATGTVIDSDKHLTATLLRRFGLPGTRGVLVRDEQQARAAIGQVGLPCVVKPVSMNQGQGVATFLQTEAQVLDALAEVQKLSPLPALIENHVAGYDHRMLVTGDELLWVYRRLPPSVTGDGKATIAELVARENRRRAAIRGEAKSYLYKIAEDEELQRFTASRYGLETDAVLDKDRKIDVAAQANIARGGTLEDVTSSVHPDNRELALRVARLVRTRTMGIDFLTPDISRSWKDVECAIVEVNRAPATSGIGDTTSIVRTLFPNLRSGRIPIAVVVGMDGFRAATGEHLHAAFAKCGLRLATADYNPRDPDAAPRITSSTLAKSVETLMLDPEADAGLVSCDAGQVERRGFPLRRCDLLIMEDEATLPWLPRYAATVMRGNASAAKIQQAVGRLARHYGEPDEGGALPAVEPIASGDGEFHIRVWRMRTMPRGWFWDQVGIAAPERTGMATHDDLLAAIRALADGGRDTLATFTYSELPDPWVRVTFEATLPLPSDRREEMRAALIAATARINAIVAAKT